jgi:hypothetical protein
MAACRGCGHYARQNFPISKSCVQFDDVTGEQLPGGNDSWICFVDGCEGHCCTSCYMTHIEAVHPELYSTDCSECKELTLYKNFVEFGVCKTCVDKRIVEQPANT